MKNNLIAEQFNRETDTQPAADSGGAVLLDKALEIFDLLADRRDIAFGYTYDGCHSRAHIMCRAMMDMGLTPKKAWAFEGKKYLCIQKPAGGEQKWWYHVAPVLSVLMPGGKVQDMVIDPGLFDGPVTLKEWGDIMEAQTDKLQIVPFGVSPEGHNGDFTPYVKTTANTDKEAEIKMESYLKLQGALPRLVYPSQSRQRLARKQAVQSQGATWVSAKVSLPPQIAVVPSPAI